MPSWRLPRAFDQRSLILSDDRARSTNRFLGRCLEACSRRLFKTLESSRLESLKGILPQKIQILVIQMKIFAIASSSSIRTLSCFRVVLTIIQKLLSCKFGQGFLIEHIPGLSVLQAMQQIVKGRRNEFKYKAHYLQLIQLGCAADDL